MSNYDNYSVLSSVYYKENPEYLKLAIDSMLNQTVVTDDYVIVKDGPLTPELDKILEDYSKKYSCIHVVALEKNSGLGAALNYGLSFCKNELVARMDTDDFSMPERCEKQIKLFQNDKSLDICGTFIDEFEDEIDNIHCTKEMPINMDAIVKYAHKRNPFNHPTVMYKKNIVENIGGYSEGHRGEDFELFTKMVFKGAKGYNIPESLLRYRAVSNQFERRSSLVDAKAVMSVVKKNYKSGYIKLQDLLFVIFMQSIGVIVPKSIGKKIFTCFFRKKHRQSITD